MSEEKSLATLRQEKPKGKFSLFLRKHCDFLFHWDSLFYFGVFAFVIGMAWMGYSLFEDSFTQLLNWDYTWQYVPFTYTYWDYWHVFYRTGHFPMYDTATWMGTDNIGSNSYYGLFDPFVILLTFFPRAWIPQTFAVMTAVKVTVGTLLARAYFRYLGIKEWTARFASLAVGASGYVSFFVGFPSFVSAAAYIPMILLGIERVIKEKKIGVLVWGLFLEGITSFFFLVVSCFFGVIYALWRYFWTLKTRTAKDNWAVISLGVASFIMGVFLSGFSVFPSLRETLLSGRSSSAGKAYLDLLIASFKSMDLRALFGLLFEQVGDNPGRELMALLSFFFPTGGHIALPLARGNYDAWTSSIFLYTPCVILFFVALINSLRLHRWDHLLAVLGTAFLLFTNFAYFFFYGFSGNGYGRWFIVLVPVIAYYCAWGFDQREQTSRWIPFAGAVLALACTIGTFYLTDFLLKGKNFPSAGVNNPAYWVSSYVTATEVYNGNIANAWYLYYQLALIFILGGLMVIGHAKKWLPKILTIAVAIEVVAAGNLAYVYDGLWSYQNSFAGGVNNVETMSYVADRINGNDDSYFRTYADFFGGMKYSFKVAGLNGAADFHSLMNFDVEDFALNNRMKTAGSKMTAYGNSDIYNPSWSGYYANKRLGTDTSLGYRYYEISNRYSSWKNEDGSAFFPTANVPFGSIEIEEASPNRNLYRVYRVDEAVRPQLGWAVDSSEIYRLERRENSPYLTNFYSNTGDRTGFHEILRAEEVQLYGAMIEEDVDLGEDFEIQESIPSTGVYSNKTLRLGNSSLRAEYYTVTNGDLMVPSSSNSYYHEGLGFFLNHYSSKNTMTGRANILRDTGMVAFSPKAGYFDAEENKTFFNKSKDGVYFELNYYNNANSGDAAKRKLTPRVYCIGTSYNEDGTVKKEHDLLSFEHNMFENARDADGNYNYYGYRSSSFGIYAKGRVEYMVFCFTGTSNSDKTVAFDPANVTLFVQDYSEFEAKNTRRVEGAFSNVKTYVNHFTFDTAYTEPRLCVTQLGFDKGWSATATMPDGSTSACKMLKLDGGLVGFVAPFALDGNGNPETIHYELRYVTPYSNYSAIAWVIGMGGFVSYLAIRTVFQIKKSKEEAVVEA